MMRIGFDAKRAFRNFTGLGNYSRFVIKSLSEYYPNNQYLLFTTRSNPHPEVLESSHQANQSVILPKGIWKLSFFKSLWRTFFLGILAERERLDIFHGLSNELPAVKRRSCKYVLTVHDLLFIRLPHLYKPIDVKIYTTKLKRSCISADVIIAISEQTKMDLVEYLSAPASKIRVVYQGVHQQFLNKAKEEQKQKIRVRYSLPQSYMLSVGTIERRKNAELILNAMAFSPEDFPNLLLVGKSTAYVKVLEQIIQKNGLHDKVKILDGVSFVDLPAIYQMAQLMVYPSLFEGFGIPIIEAQGSEIPVITSTGGCFIEAGGKGALYCPPDDPKELGRLIQKVLNEPETAHRLVMEGKGNIQRFSPGKIAGNIMQVYESVFQD